MGDRRAVWKAGSFTRSLPRSHSGIIVQLPSGGWEWRLELHADTDYLVAMGQAPSARQAKIAFTRRAAELGLVKRGPGLKAVRRG